MNHRINSSFNKAFGVHLRSLRESKGFGKREFALDADMEYSQLSKIERGQANVTLGTILLLSEALGISPHELFTFSFKIKKSAGKSSTIRK